MSRARRLVQIVRALKDAAPGALTAHQLATTFKVSERTIYRDMSKLADSGVPIEGEAGLGYLLAPDEGPPPLSLTWRQAEILWRGARLMELTADEDPAGDAEKARAILTRVLGDQRVRRIENHPLLSLTDDVRPVPAVLSAFEQALGVSCAVKIIHVDMEGEDKTVRGQPVALNQIGEAAILTISAHGHYRHIRAERVRKLTLQP